MVKPLALQKRTQTPRPPGGFGYPPHMLAIAIQIARKRGQTISDRVHAPTGLPYTQHRTCREETCAHACAAGLLLTDLLVDGPYDPAEWEKNYVARHNRPINPYMRRGTGSVA